MLPNDFVLSLSIELHASSRLPTNIMGIRRIIQLALLATAASLASAAHADESMPHQLVDRSRISSADRVAIEASPDLVFNFPKNGTFELIQSLTEIVALEARESQANPGPPGDGPSPGPPKKKEPYKCACHCTLLICGCTCKTLPLPDLPQPSKA